MFLVFGTPALFYLASAITGTIADPFPYNPWHTVMPALLLMLVLGPVEEFGWRGLGSPSAVAQIYPIWGQLDHRFNLGHMASACFPDRWNAAF